MPTNQTVSLAYAFLSEESEGDYAWALSQFRTCFRTILNTESMAVVVDRELALIAGIRATFPNAAVLVCLWHINKNVQAKTKCHFKTAAAYEEFWSQWMAVCNASTQEEYHEKWASLRRSIPSPVSKYLEDTWLDRHKEHFIAAWTRNVLHFGHAVTSRVEGSHAYLKQWICVSTLDMDEVYDKIVLAGDAQNREISKKISAERMQLPVKLKAAFWGNVVRQISAYALFKVGAYDFSGRDSLLNSRF